MFCDNLGAHVHDDVKTIFGDNKVFLCYFPPGMTNFIQPIDAGLGRSVRISVGNFLDEWLMIEENMERWESKWTAAERRIMISKWVGNAMQFMMQADNDAHYDYVTHSRKYILLDTTSSVPEHHTPYVWTYLSQPNLYPLNVYVTISS